MRPLAVEPARVSCAIALAVALLAGAPKGGANPATSPGLVPSAKPGPAASTAKSSPKPSSRKPAASARGGTPAASTAACLQGYELGQRMRKSSRLRDARSQFIGCSHDVCPAALRADCARWLTEVEADIPSVVLAARGADGGDVVGVSVTVDGKLRVDALDGKALELDPGLHRFVFEMSGEEPRAQDLVIREREKGRAVAVQFGEAGAARTRGSVAVPLALTGAGVVGLGLFTYFGLHGRSIQGELDERGCKPRCPPGEVDDMNRSYMVANISLGVGIVALGAATYFWLKREPPKPMSLDAAVMRGGIVGGVHGVF